MTRLSVVLMAVCRRGSLGNGLLRPNARGNNTTGWGVNCPGRTSSRTLVDPVAICEVSAHHELSYMQNSLDNIAAVHNRGWLQAASNGSTDGQQPGSSIVSIQVWDESQQVVW